MLMQSYDMLFDNHVAVQSSPSYRYCGPVLVSSKQDSGRAGPEKGVLYKHKCRVFLVCSYRAIKCYLASMWLCITHLAIGSVDQLRWAANSTLAEQDLWRVCCINTKVGFIWYAPHRAIICYLFPEESVLYKHKSRIYDMLIQSYSMLSIKHVAVKYSPSYRLSRPALVSRKQDSGRAGPEKSVL